MQNYRILNPNETGKGILIEYDAGYVSPTEFNNDKIIYMIKIMIANTHSKIDFNDVDKGVKKDFINMLKEKFTVRDKNLERNPMVIRGLMSAEFCFYDIENSILRIIILRDVIISPIFQ